MATAVLAIVAAAPISARADQACVTANLSNVIGTTCDIGPLQFNFTGADLLSANKSVNYEVEETLTYGTQWTATDFTFTPVANGFELSFDGGRQSITAPLSGSANDVAILEKYTITDLSGNITGTTVTGGSLSASGSGVNSSAEIDSIINDNQGDEFNQYTQTWEYLGTIYTLSGQNDNVGSPFASGTGTAAVFELGALDGSSASWDGTPTTFIYSTTPAAMPEGGSTVLFIGADFVALFCLCGFTGILRWRLIRLV